MKNQLVCLGLIGFWVLTGTGKSYAKKTQMENTSAYKSWKNKSQEKFSNSRLNFEQAMNLLLTKYYKKGISKEKLYLAATQGMLESLNDNDGQWNTVMSPFEMDELAVDFKGKTSGVGMGLKFDKVTGLANVVDIVIGGAAEKEGIKKGDQIISVNKKIYKGKDLRDLVYDLRGKEGTTVKVKILRGDRVLSKTLQRATISWNPVTSSILPDNVGVISIRYFSEISIKLIKEAILNLSKKGVRYLAIDLRGNSGGLFQEAIASADLFIPKGKVIAKTIDRTQKEKSFFSKVSPIVSKIPMIVLVDGKTSSGGELFAASLRENLNIKVVGQNTFGKWNAQMIEVLENKYAIKYTSMLFYSPKGKNYHGKGIVPDIVVARKKELSPWETKKMKVNEILNQDPQLKTAFNLVKIVN